MLFCNYLDTLSKLYSNGIFKNLGRSKVIQENYFTHRTNAIPFAKNIQSNKIGHLTNMNNV